MKFTIAVELTDAEAKTLCANSFERVVNLALEELASHEGEVTVAEEDLAELKPIVCRIWYAAQEAVRRAGE